MGLRLLWVNWGSTGWPCVPPRLGLSDSARDRRTPNEGHGAVSHLHPFTLRSWTPWSTSLLPNQKEHLLLQTPPTSRRTHIKQNSPLVTITYVTSTQLWGSSPRLPGGLGLSHISVTQGACSPSPPSASWRGSFQTQVGNPWRVSVGETCSPASPGLSLIRTIGHLRNRLHT